MPLPPTAVTATVSTRSARVLFLVSCCAEQAAQLAWLSEDLAAVNRSRTPWVIVTSHYPLYCTGCGGGPQHAAYKGTGTGKGKGRATEIKEGAEAEEPAASTAEVSAEWYASNDAEFLGISRPTSAATARMLDARRRQQQARSSLGSGAGPIREAESVNILAPLLCNGG